MLNALKWIISSNAIIVLVSFFVSILMMRYIPPREYGLVAMVLPLFLFVNMFTSFGTNKSIISKKQLTSSELSSLFWAKAAISSSFVILLLLIIPQVCSFYNEPELKWVILLFAPIIIINTLNGIYNGLYNKELKFRALAISEIIVVIFSGAIGIYLAKNTFGYKSLIIKDLSAAILTFILGIINIKWFPLFKFKLSELQYHIKFGAGFTATNVLVFFSRNLDDILIGKRYGSLPLGLYSKGYALLTLPLTLISKSFARVLLPYVAQQQDNILESTSLYLKAVRGVLSINTPLCLFVFFTADPVIPYFLGENWIPVIPYIKIFSILCVFQSLGPLNSLVYEGLNKTTKMLKYAIVTQGINITSIILGFVLGNTVYHIAIAYTIGNMITFFVNQYFISITLKYDYLQTLKNIAPFILSGMLTISFLYFSESYMKMNNLLGHMVIFGLGCFILFYGFLYFIDKSKFYETFTNIRKAAFLKI